MENTDFIVGVILTIVTIIASFIVFKTADKGSDIRASALFIFLTSFIPFIAIIYSTLFMLAMFILLVDFLFSWLLKKL